MMSPELSCCLYKVISSYKREERSKVEVKASFTPESDKDLLKLLSSEYDESQPLFFHCFLHRLVKIEDWFKDGTTIVKSLRKGRGRNPYIDSTVKFRIQMIVNEEVVTSNYPEAYDFFEGDNLKTMTKEE